MPGRNKFVRKFASPQKAQRKIKTSMANLSGNAVKKSM